MQGTVGKDHCVELRVPPQEGKPGRTFYMFAADEEESSAWAVALATNIMVLQASAASKPLDEQEIQQNMTLMQAVSNDPTRTLAFFKAALQTDLWEDELRPYVERFYDLVQETGGF
jgi:hypothetical protein